MADPVEGAPGEPTGTEPAAAPAAAPSNAAKAMDSLAGEITIGDKKYKVDEIMGWQKDSTDYKHFQPKFTQTSQELAEMRKKIENAGAGFELQELLDKHPDLAVQIIELTKKVKGAAGGDPAKPVPGNEDNQDPNAAKDDLTKRVEAMEKEKVAEKEKAAVAEQEQKIKGEVEQATQKFPNFDKKGQTLLYASLMLNPGLNIAQFAEQYHKDVDAQKDQIIKDYWAKKGKAGAAGGGSSQGGPAADAGGTPPKDLKIGEGTAKAAMEMLATLSASRNS